MHGVDEIVGASASDSGRRPGAGGAAVTEGTGPQSQPVGVVRAAGEAAGKGWFCRPLYVASAACASSGMDRVDRRVAEHVRRHGSASATTVSAARRNGQPGDRSGRVRSRSAAASAGGLGPVSSDPPSGTDQAGLRNHRCRTARAPETSFDPQYRRRMPSYSPTPRPPSGDAGRPGTARIRPVDLQSEGFSRVRQIYCSDHSHSNVRLNYADCRLRRVSRWGACASGGRGKENSVETPVESTRERLLNIAEQRFGEGGYEGTSLRAITVAAAANIAAVELPLRLEGGPAAGRGGARDGAGQHRTPAPARPAGGERARRRPSS